MSSTNTTPNKESTIPTRADPSDREKLLIATSLLTAGTDDFKNPEAALVREYGFRDAPEDHSFFNLLNNARRAEVLADLEQLIKNRGLTKVYKMETRLHGVFKDMSSRGIYADRLKLTALREKHTGLVTESESALQKEFGPDLNLRSNDAVLAAVRAKGIVLEHLRDAELAKIDHPIARNLLQFRRSSKLTRDASDYLGSMDEKGFIQAQWKSMGAVTGRASVAKPNLQGVDSGEEMRECFTAPPGYKLCVLDVSAQDLRTIAVVTKDKAMLRAFAESDAGEGMGIHEFTAAGLYDKPMAEITHAERKLGKTLNCAMINGQKVGNDETGFKASAAEAGLFLTDEEAARHHAKFYKLYPEVSKFHASARAQSFDRKVTEVSTVMGRQRLLPDPKSRSASSTEDWGRFTALINMPVQGTGGDCMKMALGILSRDLPEKDAYVPIFSHDEIGAYVPEKDAEATAYFIRSTIEETCNAAMKADIDAAFAATGVPFSFRVKAVIGDSWADKERLEPLPRVPGKPMGTIEAKKADDIKRALEGAPAQAVPEMAGA